MLKLDWSRAAHALDWHPVLPLKNALRLTAEWYRRRNEGENARDITSEQIERYTQLSKDNQERTACAPTH